MKNKKLVAVGGFLVLGVIVAIVVMAARSSNSRHNEVVNESIVDYIDSTSAEEETEESETFETLAEGDYPVLTDPSEPTVSLGEGDSEYEIPWELGVIRITSKDLSSYDEFVADERLQHDLADVWFDVTVEYVAEQFQSGPGWCSVGFIDSRGSTGVIKFDVVEELVDIHWDSEDNVSDETVEESTTAVNSSTDEIALHGYMQRAIEYPDVPIENFMTKKDQAYNPKWTPTIYGSELPTEVVRFESEGYDYFDMDVVNSGVVARYEFDANSDYDYHNAKELAEYFDRYNEFVGVELQTYMSMGGGSKQSQLAFNMLSMYFVNFGDYVVFKHVVSRDEGSTFFIEIGDKRFELYLDRDIEDAIFIKSY